MDPNANLKRQREIAAEILRLTNLRASPRGREFEDLGTELAELITVLDEWIENGGFLPSAWCVADLWCRDCGCNDVGGSGLV